MICPECGIEMIRRPSKFGEHRFWWGCRNYPACRVTSSEHPNGEIASTPCTEEEKRLRQDAHRISELIWGEWKSPRCKKNEMYDWLKYNTKSGHFGHMRKDELIKTIEKLKILSQWQHVK